MSEHVRNEPAQYGELLKINFMKMNPYKLKTFSELLERYSAEYIKNYATDEELWWLGEDCVHYGGTEFMVPHFYADKELIDELFADFEIIGVTHVEDWGKNNIWARCFQCPEVSLLQIGKVIKMRAGKILAAAAAVILLCGCGNTVQSDKAASVLPKYQYTQKKSVEVAGRQGIAAENGYYYVSGSTTLTRYDRNWQVVAENTDPFSAGYTAEVNHIGDIDVYQNEIYCGVELFLDGVASNIQIAVYDAETLQLKRSFPFSEESGQTECSGIAVNPDNKTVWMCSWADGDSGRYLYKYDLDTGAYLGKVHMHAVPQYIQGMAYDNGSYYVTADDGDADLNEPDHVYRFDIEDGKTDAAAVEELILNDVTKQGEIEGLTFDKENRELLVLYNRGARIILGMPSGFYEGYDREIHEVFLYSMSTFLR